MKYLPSAMLMFFLWVASCGSSQESSARESRGTDSGGEGSTSLPGADGSGSSTTGSSGVVQPTQDLLTGGSRLTPTVKKGTDGSSIQTQEFHDNNFNSDCEVLTASDGNSYCLPVYSGAESTIYTDSVCTQKAVWLPDCGYVNVGNYLTIFARSAIVNPCSESFVYEPIHLTAASSTAYALNGNNCQNQNAPAAGYSAYAYDVVSLNSFVQFYSP